jgi:TonB family protein
MNSVPPATVHPEEPAWSAGRWTFYLALAFALHVGLFYAFSEREPPPPRATLPAPAIQNYSIAPLPVTWEDPTLFALPHPRGFAGQTWLRRPQFSVAPFRWSEPARMLDLPVTQLGSWLFDLARTDPLGANLPSLSPRPTLTVLPRLDRPHQPRDSKFRLVGELEHREWRNAPPTLPLAPGRDGVTNTLVQLLVDGRGFTISATLLRPGSGDSELDQAALRFARTARFNPDGAPSAPAVGTIIFEWATTPPPNAPPSAPVLTPP